MKLFSTSVAKAQTGKKSSIRAKQAWPILTAVAHNRQTIRYLTLAKMLGYSDCRPMGRILGYIQFYCQEHELPQINNLVVNESGEPGDGCIKDELYLEREAIYDYDWYDIYPPSTKDLTESLCLSK